MNHRWGSHTNNRWPSSNQPKSAFLCVWEGWGLNVRELRWQWPDLNSLFVIEPAKSQHYVRTIMSLSSVRMREGSNENRKMNTICHFLYLASLIHYWFNIEPVIILILCFVFRGKSSFQFIRVNRSGRKQKSANNGQNGVVAVNFKFEPCKQGRQPTKSWLTIRGSLSTTLTVG